MGVPNTQLSFTAATFNSTDAELIAANANREYLLVINDSDTILYLKFGAAAVANEGIRVEANGGSIEFSARNGNLDVRALNGIHGAAAAAKTALVTEG